MIKISKSLLFNPAKIWVSDIECNFKNVIKITSMLDCKWIVVTIDSLEKDNTLLPFIKEQGLRYSLRERNTLSLIKEQGLRVSLKKQPADHVEISVVTPYALFEEILKKAISENPENIFIFNLLNPANYDIHSQHSVEELIAIGITDVFIAISLDENALLISTNKFLTHSKELYRKIKKCDFSNII